MRKLPTTPVANVIPSSKSESLTRSYDVITPLFGGGAEASKNDVDFLIRPSSIIGQLRFWWRATRGGEFNGNLQAMKDKEDEIWGSALKRDEHGNIIKGPSEVRIRVIVTNPGEAKKPWKIVLNKDKKTVPRAEDIAHGYSSFPLQPTKDDLKEASKMRSEDRPTLIENLRVGIQFDLILEYPKRFSEDIEATLWAWEMFGGVGARTRRGFGSIQIQSKGIANTTDLEKAIASGINNYVSSGKLPDDVPYLSSNLKKDYVIKNFSWHDL